MCLNKKYKKKVIRVNNILVLVLVINNYLSKKKKTLRLKLNDISKCMRYNYICLYI